MRIRSAHFWGMVGSIAFVAIALLSLMHEESEGFWLLLVSTIGGPGMYIGGMLSGLFYGTVEGPLSFRRAVYVVYMGAIGFLISYFLTKLVFRIIKKK